MKVNKHFTKKRVSKTNHKDVQVAEQLKSNNKEEMAAVTETLVAEIGGKQEGEY